MWSVQYLKVGHKNLDGASRIARMESAGCVLVRKLRGGGSLGGSPADRQQLRISDWVKTQFISTRSHQGFGFVKTASGVSLHCGPGAPRRLGSGEIAVACILAYGATAAV